MPSLSNTHVAHQTWNKIVYISKKLKVIYVSSVWNKIAINNLQMKCSTSEKKKIYIYGIEN